MVWPCADPMVLRPTTELSYNGALTELFLELPGPKLFMIGVKDAYLSDIDAKWLTLDEIPESGHWRLYFNPKMWRGMVKLRDGVPERGRRHVGFLVPLPRWRCSMQIFS